MKRQKRPKQPARISCGRGRLYLTIVRRQSCQLVRKQSGRQQVALAAKQMIGAHRQFVHAPETRQRLPELALLAGSILSYLAAVLPPAPTGFWDRKPQPTSGRLRRVLAKADFPERSVPLARIRKKCSVTGQLPKGYFGQRQKPAA